MACIKILKMNMILMSFINSSELLFVYIFDKRIGKFMYPNNISINSCVGFCVC